MHKRANAAPLYLCLIIIAAVAALSFIPEFHIGDWKYRRLNVLADIQKDGVEEETNLVTEIDSTDSLATKVAEVKKSDCPPGVTCIRDFSADSSALKKFFNGLEKLKSKGGTTRVAFYGDSFIEGDVFCGSFRDTLQQVFGGEGVGFVPITSTITYFRKSFRHKFDNFRTLSLIGQRDSSYLMGPSGFTFLPAEGNWVEYKSPQHRNQSFELLRLYYTNTEDAAVLYTVNSDTSLMVEELDVSRDMREWTFKSEDFKSIRLEFYPYSGLQLFGASLEGKGGVYVDNFSLRGNSGLSLSGINKRILSGFNRYRDYKLVILQFGLNSVTEDTLNYKAYTKRMVQVVNGLKREWPNASFLLLSVGDRSTNSGGTMKTMSAIPAMRNAQQAIARRTGIAFWDMYEAMGGRNSMVRFAQARPPLAAKDYTHLTFKGGEKLAGKLAKSLIVEFEKHKQRKNELP